MAPVRSRSWQHLLLGKRYEKLLVWAARLSESKSRGVFRRDLRDILYAAVKQKVNMDVDMDILRGLFYVMSLVQDVIFEALHGNRRSCENETEHLADMNLLLCIFEPDAMRGHILALENKAAEAYRKLGNQNSSENRNALVRHLPQVVMLSRQIIDELE